MKRLISTLMFAAAVATTAPAGSANDVVEIRLRGYYYSEPANVHVTVAVEPGPNHRRLRLEADGDAMFRSSEMALTGDGRLHQIVFKNLSAGAYTLRAAVLSGDGVVAAAEHRLLVTGKDARQ